MGLPSLEEIRYFVFDFDGVMTDDSVYLDVNGNELIRCSRFDGAGIMLVYEANKMNLANIQMMIVSSERNQVAHGRARKLGLECHTGIENKFDYLVSYASEKLKISSEQFFSQLVYFGNDLNDLKMIRNAFFSIAPINSHELVKLEADLVLSERGGEGFVRAAIELLLGTNVILAIFQHKYA
jgi:YrbI family 3-deoxy-D-manno-octulosonate 8-phosphate phosphatase